MSHLLNEIGLRLIKVAIAALLGLLLFAVLTGPLANPGSVELVLLCWLSAAALVLLVGSGMF